MEIIEFILSNLVTAGILFGAGLLVGWNCLPQPEIVRKAFTFVRDMIGF